MDVEAVADTALRGSDFQSWNFDHLNSIFNHHGKVKRPSTLLTLTIELINGARELFSASVSTLQIIEAGLLGL